VSSSYLAFYSLPCSQAHSYNVFLQNGIQCCCENGGGSFRQVVVDGGNNEHDEIIIYNNARIRIQWSLSASAAACVLVVVGEHGFSVCTTAASVATAADSQFSFVPADPKEPYFCGSIIQIEAAIDNCYCY
jgi:hypothetical protein